VNLEALAQRQLRIGSGDRPSGLDTLPECQVYLGAYGFDDRGGVGTWYKGEGWIPEALGARSHVGVVGIHSRSIHTN
jgi:hypothetical protein